MTGELFVCMIKETFVCEESHERRRRLGVLPKSLCNVGRAVLCAPRPAEDCGPYLFARAGFGQHARLVVEARSLSYDYMTVVRLSSSPQKGKSIRRAHLDTAPKPRERSA